MDDSIEGVTGNLFDVYLKREYSLSGVKGMPAFGAAACLVVKGSQGEKGPFTCHSTRPLPPFWALPPLPLLTALPDSSEAPRWARPPCRDKGHAGPPFKQELIADAPSRAFLPPRRPAAYFLEAYRPVRKGDLFLVRGGMRAVEFKVWRGGGKERGVGSPRSLAAIYSWGGGG